MPKVKLTDAAIQRFQAPPGGRVEYFDATLPGFGMRVAGPTPRNPTGRRSWVLFYRYRGEQKRLTIEPAYPALSLADARKRAGDALQLLAEGKDPGAEKAQAKAERVRDADTLARVVDQFFKRHMEGKKRAAGYVSTSRRIFDNHVLPHWGNREIQTITRRDVIELLDAITDQGGAADAKGVRRGGPIAANRTLSAIRVLFNWALRRSIVEANPCAVVERPGEENRRERTLSAEELRALWPEFTSLGYPFGDFLKMTLITAQRRSEVAGMRWADINLVEGTWTLSSDATKAGRGHVVPLSGLALEILSSAPRKTYRAPDGEMTPSPYVFTTEGDTPISGFSGAKGRVEKAVAAACKAAGQPAPEQWGVHDLRRTAATEMGRLGVSRFVIGRVLNHADRGVTGIYDRHSYTAEKRHALETWGAYVTGLVNPAGAAAPAVAEAA